MPDVAMWLPRRRSSNLLDRTDRQLIATDRKIRRSLAKGHPRRWTPPEESKLGDRSEAHFLLDLYRADFLAHQRQTRESLTALRRVLEESQTAQIRARAAQGQCEILLAEFLDLREDQPEAAQRSEGECRDLCERAAVEFKGFDWSCIVKDTFHAVLGILDYHSGDRLGAKFHLSRSLQLSSEIDDRHDERATGSAWVLGLAYFYSGVLANETNDVSNAVKYLNIALRSVPALVEVSALMQLASASLKAGDPKGARKFAKRGLKSPRLKESGKGMASELKAWLAEAELELGEKREAARLFREVIESGDAPSWESRAKENLRKIEQDA